MVGHDVSSPDLEPLFANHFEVLGTGNDIFLDIGIIDPRDIGAMLEAAEKTGEQQSIKFSVLERVAMSPASFVLLANKINAVMRLMVEKEKANAGAREEPTVTKQR